MLQEVRQEVRRSGAGVGPGVELTEVIGSEDGGEVKGAERRPALEH